MVSINYEPKFSKAIEKIRDKILKEQVKKKIKDIIDNPEDRGEHLSYRKLEKKVYIKGYRSLFSYDKRKDRSDSIDFDRRDRIYKK